jgi:hypothetical protein
MKSLEVLSGGASFSYGDNVASTGGDVPSPLPKI